MLSRRELISAGLMAVAGIGLSACSSDTGGAAAGSSAPVEADAPDSVTVSSSVGAGSILVAYFSAQGHTEAVAKTIADTLGADTFAIEPAQPYSGDDLNYNDDASRVCQEHEDTGRNVELVRVTPDAWDGYGIVLVGYPIWWGDAAWAVDNFIKGNDFTGKTVIPFCTSASSPLGESGELLAEMAGAGDWQEGMRFSSSADPDKVAEWVNSLGLFEG